MAGVSYDVIFRDYGSATFQKIKAASDKTFGKLYRLHQKYQKEADQSKRKTQDLGNTISGIQSKIAGIAAGLGVGLFAKGVVEATGEYERFNAVLTNTFGSAAEAANSMKLLQQFSAKTPFQLNQLTDSYVKLVNRGFKPTEKELTKLGDLASSLGKPFDQLTEALLDAQTGEFERLKEFGVKAKKEGDKITFNFKGQATSVQNTESAIRDYILSLGDMKGVTGGMNAISKTLEGRISNLKDAFNLLQVEIGQKLRPVITFFLDKGNAAIAFFSEFFSKVERLKEPLLALYEATLPARTAFTELLERLGLINTQTSAAEGVISFLKDGIIALTPVVEAVSKALGTALSFIKDNWEGIKLLTIAIIAGKVAYTGFNIVMGAYNAIMTIARVATIAMAGKMSLLNITMLANPVGLVIAGIAALVAGFIYAYKHFDKFRGAVNGVWAGLKEFGKGIADIVITRIKELISAISGVGKMLSQLFNRDFSGAWETGKNVMANLFGVNTIKQAIDTGKKTGEAFRNAYNEEVSNVVKKDNGIGYFRNPSLIQSDSGAGYWRDTTKEEKTKTPAITPVKPSSLNSGVDSITADKKISKQINVNIDKLVESFSVATNNIKESPAQIKEMVIETLVNAVRDAELSFA
jgi:hypothetical protein